MTVHNAVLGVIVRLFHLFHFLFVFVHVVFLRTSVSDDIIVRIRSYYGSGASTYHGKIAPCLKNVFGFGVGATMLLVQPCAVRSYAICFHVLAAVGKCRSASVRS